MDSFKNFIMYDLNGCDYKIVKTIPKGTLSLIIYHYNDYEIYVNISYSANEIYITTEKLNILYKNIVNTYIYISEQYITKLFFNNEKMYIQIFNKLSMNICLNFQIMDNDLLKYISKFLDQNDYMEICAKYFLL